MVHIKLQLKLVVVVHKVQTHLYIVDEIKQHYDCRYLSPCEVVWRFFGCDKCHSSIIFHIKRQTLINIYW